MSRPTPNPRRATTETKFKPSARIYRCFSITAENHYTKITLKARVSNPSNVFSSRSDPRSISASIHAALIGLGFHPLDIKIGIGAGNPSSTEKATS